MPPPVSPTPKQKEALKAKLTSCDWQKPAALIEKLPKGWSVLDMWRLPDDVPKDEADHGALVAGLARSDASAFASGALAQDAPISAYEELVACLGLAAFFTAPAFGPLLVVAATVCLACGMFLSCALMVAAVVVLAVWKPAPLHSVKHNFVVRAIYRYFSFRIAFSPESRYTADRAYIHVCAPHALFPIGGLLWQFSPWKTSRYHGRAGVASVVTRLPLWRQLFFAIGCVPAERPVMSALLKNGWHTGVAVDGIAGIFADASRSHNKPAVIMKARKGVVRLAISHGTPLVPVWFFVARRPLRNLLGQWGERLSRKFKISLVIPYGRFGPGMPPVPRRAAITAVVGRPVEVPPPGLDGKPREADVDAVHAQLCDAMVAAFDAQKEAFGWADRDLEIL